jgi:uncharacterized membrane protein YdjX (TVP38/TMEM64 family)
MDNIQVKYKWLIAAAGVVVAVFFLWSNRQFGTELFSLLSNREVLTAHLEQFGIWGPVLAYLILSLQVIIPVIPGGPVIQAATGYLYGFAGGLTINLLGLVGTSQLAFFLSRRAGESFIYRLVPAKVLERWQKVAKRPNFFYFLVNFWFPLIPDRLTNYLAGLTSISFWLFLLANLLGRLPGALIFTSIGAYGATLSCSESMVSVGAIPAAINNAAMLLVCHNGLLSIFSG